MPNSPVMKARILIVLLFVIIQSACNENKKSVDKKEDIQELEKDFPSICISKNEKESILLAILETLDFQMFLHPEIKERLPIRIVKNDFITSDLNIISNGQKVIFKDSLILPESKVHKINVKNIDCNRKELSYSVFYPIEAAFISGTVKKENKHWIATVEHAGEID